VCFTTRGETKEEREDARVFLDEVGVERWNVEADAINLTSEDDAHWLTVLPRNRYCCVGGTSIGGEAGILGLRWAHRATIETGSCKERSKKKFLIELIQCEQIVDARLACGKAIDRDTRAQQIHLRSFNDKLLIKIPRKSISSQLPSQIKANH
jgi:hypothetical protein